MKIELDSPDLLEKNVRELLNRFVSMPSVFPGEKDFADEIQKLLVTHGFHVRTVDSETDRYNIIASFGESQKHLAFYGHMDTVAPAQGYSNPYTLVEDGDVLRGLGATDMKGGVVAMLVAGCLLKAEGKPVKLIFGVDEENISLGANDLCDSGALDDVAAMLVPETGQVKDFNQPYQLSLGRRGRLVFNIEIKGRKAHAAEAHNGINAIEAASTFILSVPSLSFPSHPDLGEVIFIPEAISSETESLSLPEMCTLRLTALTTPSVSHNEVCRALEDLMRHQGIQGSVSFSARKTPFSESYVADVRDPFVAMVVQNASFDGVEFMYNASVADENVFAAKLGIPVVTLGPTGGGEHTSEEWVSFKSLITLTERYIEIARKYHQTN